MFESIFRAGLAVGTLTVPCAALAQEAAPVVPAAATAEEEPVTGIADIIVTANRRAESVQKSSLAIAVIGGDNLASQGVAQASDLQTIVPSVSISQSGSATVTFIRGVGSFDTNANAESAIAYNINGAYISRPAGIGPIFFDLERVEVLKGPQGTLYGRNASGGAINLITKRPGHVYSADISIEAGNYDFVRGTAAVTLPLSSTLSIRAAAQITQRNGYLSDGYNDQKTQAVRLTGLWEPDDRFSAFVTGEYTHIGGMGSGAVPRALTRVLGSDPWTGPSERISQPPTAAIPGGTVIRDDGFLDIDVHAISTEFNYNLGPATLTFIPSYRELDSKMLTYVPGFVYQQNETSKMQSYELRLGNQSAALNWVLGAYLFDEDQTQNYEVAFLPVQKTNSSIALGSHAYAFFGETTYSLTDRLRAIGGLRYSNERKRQDGVQTFTVPNRPSVNSFGRREDSKLTYRVGTEFDIAPRNMLFATLSTGFKAGGFFQGIAAPNNTYQPENLTAYTVGSRNRFLDNNVQFNIEGFYWKYKNKNERYFGATTAGSSGFITTNAGSATLYGFDADLTLKISPNDQLTFSTTYIHSKYDSFIYNGYTPNSLQGIPAGASGCKLGTPQAFTITPNPIDVTQTVDCSGQQLIHAPKWTGGASYQHIFNLNADWNVVFGSSAQFASPQFLSNDFIKSGYDNGYVTANLDLTLRQGSGLSVQLWVRNVTNQAVYNGGLRHPVTLPGGDPTLFYADIRPPRTVGVTVGGHF